MPAEEGGEAGEVEEVDADHVILLGKGGRYGKGGERRGRGGGAEIAIIVRQEESYGEGLKVSLGSMCLFSWNGRFKRTIGQTGILKFGIQGWWK